MRCLIGWLAILGTSPAMASGGVLPTDVQLWGGLRSGMTKAQAAKLYPSREGFIAPNCPVEIRLVYSRATLASVVLQAKLGRNDCIIKAIDSVRGRYGMGEGKKVSSSFAVGSSVEINSFGRETWRAGPVKITAMSGGKSLSWISYTVKTNDKYW